MRFAHVGRPSRFNRPSLHDAIWWLLAIGIAVASVILFWMIVTPVSPVGNWRPQMAQPMPEFARRAMMGGFDPFNRASPDARPGTAAAVVTDLPLSVYGIRVDAGTGGGTAILAGADGVQQLYRIGDEVMPGVTLSALAFDHVTINRGGVAERVYIDQSRPAPVAEPDRQSQPGATVAASVADPSQSLSARNLRQGIAVAPYAQDGAITGLEVQATGDGSAFRAAGLQAGDIVTAIGGRRIESSGDAMVLMKSLRPEADISLTVRRGSREVPVNIKVSE